MLTSAHMTSELRYPQPPASANSLAAAWMDAQEALPSGWWISLENEYGTEAFWIARAEVPQADFENEYLEAVADTAEGALNELWRRIVAAELAASQVEGVPAPVGAAGYVELTEAWRTAQAAIPAGWWIAGVAGLEGAGNEAGWIATAAGGPGSGYDGRQALGSTPEDALRRLASGE